MRSVLQGLLTCPRADCRNTELCYGMVWLVFALAKVLAVFSSTKIVPPCTTHQAGSEQYSRVAWFGPRETLSWKGWFHPGPFPSFHTLGLD